MVNGTEVNVAMDLPCTSAALSLCEQLEHFAIRTTFLEWGTWGTLDRRVGRL
jgi:hypothetical protein